MSRGSRGNSLVLFSPRRLSFLRVIIREAGRQNVGTARQQWVNIAAIVDDRPAERGGAGEN